MSEPRQTAKSLRELLAEASIHTGEVAEEPDLELFCVQMGSERFAFEANLIQEVVRLPPVTPLPGAPSHLLGVCAHRGEVLPVVDLSRIMGRGESRIHERSRLAVARVEGMALALLTDQVDGLSKIAAARVEAPPVGASQRGAELMAGVTSDAKGTFSVLDLRRLVEIARSRAVNR